MTLIYVMDEHFPFALETSEPKKNKGRKIRTERKTSKRFDQIRQPDNKDQRKDKTLEEEEERIVIRRVRFSFTVLPGSSLPIPAASMTTRQKVIRWRA